MEPPTGGLFHDRHRANPAAAPDARRDDLAGRLMAAALGALEMQAVYLGDRLGLYRPSPRKARPPRPSWPSEPASIHATRGNGSSSRRSAAILDVDDPAAAPEPAATRCRTATPPS